jgi:sulfatase maturation enzyme AslB (radical SAM superfamily)
MWGLTDFFSQTEMDEAAERELAVYFQSMQSLVEHLEETGLEGELQISLQKLKVIGEVFESYLRGDLEPRHVGPSRQANLIVTCNARCVYCPGLYTKEISSGIEVDSKRLAVFSEEEAERAFQHPEDIVHFFMNGSEFLLYKHWRKVARLLAENGTKISLSTNGMMLTRDNVDFVVQNRLVQKVDISLDGASKEVFESIRERVDLDRIKENIKYLIERTDAEGYEYNLNFAFLLLRRNYHELPGVVKMVSRLRGVAKLPRISISVRPLDVYEFPDYKDLLFEEHHSRIDPRKLEAVLRKTVVRALMDNIEVNAFPYHEHAERNLVESLFNDRIYIPPPPPALTAMPLLYLDMTETGDALDYSNDGWSEPEEWGRWTLGKESTLKVSLPTYSSPGVKMVTTFKALLSPEGPDQSVTVLANGQPVAEWSLCHGDDSGQTQRTVFIPEHLLNEKDTLQVSFGVSTPMSPRSLGISEDPRDLGLAVSNIRFLQARQPPAPPPTRLANVAKRLKLPLSLRVEDDRRV